LYDDDDDDKITTIKKKTKLKCFCRLLNDNKCPYKVDDGGGGGLD
jgi:hypothetical protein